jgi:hypothetical protein
MDELRKTLRALGPNPPAGELPPNLKPRPLLAPLLASFQDVARAVVRQVRMQSQKLDAAQPYALRGTLLKTGQSVNVEQVPLLRLAGPSPREALRQARAIPKGGKFPNLMPLVFVEEAEDIGCAAETAVEGVPLNELLAARGALDAQEVYLVLAGVDAALGQLEKAERSVRRLRLEDIFLFTGFNGEMSADTGLLGVKLNEWPGFSIVLRAHPCLHSMAGRGTDPAMLLPLDPKIKGDAEPLWNGGWMAALGTFLTGANDEAGQKPSSPGAEALQRLLTDELANAHRGAPASRAAFLSRFVRVMRDHDLAHVESGGLWQTLGGKSSAQSRAAEVARREVARPAPASPPAAAKPAAAAKPPAKAAADAVPLMLEPPWGAEEAPPIGFAEALMQPPGQGQGQRGLRKIGPGVQAAPGAEESSWTGFHPQKPLWVRVTMLSVASIVLGALLALLQGRAFWQRTDSGQSPEAQEHSAGPTPSAALFPHDLVPELPARGKPAVLDAAAPRPATDAADAAKPPPPDAANLTATKRGPAPQ